MAVISALLKLFLSLLNATLVALPMAIHTHVQGAEKQLIKRMKGEGLALKKVARLLKRDVKTIKRHLKPSRGKTVVKGRPVVITPTWYRRLKAALEALLKKASAE